MQIRDLLWAAGDQNSAVSQSCNRIHSRSVAVNTVQSAHSPRSPPRREGRGGRRDPYDDRFDRDDRRRVPTPPQELGLTPLGNKVTDASTVLVEELRLTPGNHALMQDPLSCKVWSTGTELTVKAMTETRPPAVGFMFQDQTVLAEPSGPQ